MIFTCAYWGMYISCSWFKMQTAVFCNLICFIQEGFFMIGKLLFCFVFFPVLGIRDESPFPSPALCHRQSSFVLVREDGAGVSLGQFSIPNNTICCPRKIHHCPDQLLRGCRRCPLALSVDPAQLVLSASSSPFLQQTGTNQHDDQYGLHSSRTLTKWICFS